MRLRSVGVAGLPVNGPTSWDGMPVAWMPVLEDAVRFLSRRARAGDVVLTIGAGDVERAAPLILAELG